MHNNKYNFKIISYEYTKFRFILDIIKLITGDLNNIQSFVSDKKRAIKRSPHVFSKSQESFGYKTYLGVFNINSIPKEKNKYPIEITNIRSIISHIVPGRNWRWNRT